MPKVRVGGDCRPVPLKDEGWRNVVALAATVAAIRSNQKQPKGNRFDHAAPVGTMELAVAVRTFVDRVDELHWE
jgi:hypothetical protein